jgi:hypothetical protein
MYHTHEVKYGYVDEAYIEIIIAGMHILSMYGFTERRP